MIRPTIEVLAPENYFDDKPSLQGMNEIMDFMITQIESHESPIEQLPDEILAAMEGRSFDYQGLLSWYNLYKPYIGSNTFIEFTLNMLGVTAEIVEWYETNNPTNTYDLVLNKSASIEKDKLIDLILRFKNIESKLASIRTKDAPVRFTLDKSTLDRDILSGSAGTKYRDVAFFFRNVYGFDLEWIPTLYSYIRRDREWDHMLDAEYLVNANKLNTRNRIMLIDMTDTNWTLNISWEDAEAMLMNWTYADSITGTSNHSSHLVQRYHHHIEDSVFFDDVFTEWSFPVSWNQLGLAEVTWETVGENHFVDYHHASVLVQRFHENYEPYIMIDPDLFTWENPINWLGVEDYTWSETEYNVYTYSKYTSENI